MITMTILTHPFHLLLVAMVLTRLVREVAHVETASGDNALPKAA